MHCTDEMSSSKHRQWEFDTISRHPDPWSTGLERMLDLKLLITVCAESLILYGTEKCFTLFRLYSAHVNGFYFFYAEQTT